MKEPIIIINEPIDSLEYRVTLVIPYYYLREVKHWKIKSLWWILRLWYRGIKLEGKG